MNSSHSGSHHTNSILSRYKLNSFWNNFDHLFYLKFVDLYQLLKYSCFVITWHHIDIQLLWLVNWIPEGSRRWIKIADCEGCHEYCPSPQIQGCVDIPSCFFFFYYLHNSQIKSGCIILENLLPMLANIQNKALTLLSDMTTREWPMGGICRLQFKGYRWNWRGLDLRVYMWEKTRK